MMTEYGYNIPGWDYQPEGGYEYWLRDGASTVAMGMVPTLDELARDVGRFYVVPQRSATRLFYCLDGRKQIIFAWHTDSNGHIQAYGVGKFFEALAPHVADQIMLLDLEFNAKGIHA